MLGIMHNFLDLIMDIASSAFLEKNRKKNINISQADKDIRKMAKHTRLVSEILTTYNCKTQQLS